MRRRLLAGLAIGCGAIVIGSLLAATDLGGRIEDLTYDWRVRATARPAPADSPVAVVEINESSLRQLAPLVGQWPWPRLVHAAVIEFLARAGARVIAYDILFTEPDTRGELTIGGQTVSGSTSDAILADAIARAGNVVLLADATYEGTVDESEAGAAGTDAVASELPGPEWHPGEGFEVRPHLTLPIAALTRAAAGIGHNYFVDDPGGTARRMHPFVAVGDHLVPSLGLAAALAAEKLTPDDVALTAGGAELRVGAQTFGLLHQPTVGFDGQSRPSVQILLAHPAPRMEAGGVSSIFPSESFFNVLLAEDQIGSGQPPAVDPDRFRDRVVFVGTTAAGLGDVVSTPFRGPGARGVHLHATLAENVLSVHEMTRASRAADLVPTTLAGLAVGLTATIVPVFGAVPIALVLVGALGGWLTLAVGGGQWVGATAPAGAAALALFGGVAWQYFVEGRSKREIRQLFGRYVSPEVIAELVRNPALATLGGERREMSVLFSDIRGFTSASERARPEEVVTQLNEYFSAMVEVLFRHRGTLDKFVGDMVMGLFGAPVADARHADHAVACALEMSAELRGLNARWQAEGRPALDIGIGINSGEMIVGNIGSERQMSYTVIGDAVNLAARLESLNKDFGTRILISEDTRRRLQGIVETREMGKVTVKGRAEPVFVHEVLDAAEGQ